MDCLKILILEAHTPPSLVPPVRTHSAPSYSAVQLNSLNHGHSTCPGRGAASPPANLLFVLCFQATSWRSSLTPQYCILESNSSLFHPLNILQGHCLLPSRWFLPYFRPSSPASSQSHPSSQTHPPHFSQSDLPSDYSKVQV